MSLKRFGLAVGFASLLLVALVWLDSFQPTPYLRLRNFFRDSLARVGRKAPADPNLVFLAIDSDSVGLDEETDTREMFGLTNPESKEARALQLMSQRFPWPREVYALVLERLVNAGAKVVVFDLTFPTSTDGDEVFRDALERSRDQVIIGSSFVDPSWNGLAKVGASHTRPTSSLVPQTAPMDDRVAYTNFWPDADDVVRNAQYRVTFEQVKGSAPEPSSERFVSLAARALEKAGFGDRLPKGIDEHAIRFAGMARNGFPPHSIFEIFVPDYWQHNYKSGDFFRGKIVVIGAEGNWQHDEHRTPLGTMPGTELHLNAINAALQHEFIREIDGRAALGLIVLAAALAILLCYRVRSPWLRLGAVVICDLAAFGLALVCFNRWGIFLPLVAPLIEFQLVVFVGLIADFAFERMEKTRLRRTFERYVSHDVVRHLIDQPKLYSESLGGVIKPVTILFSDIRGYSKVTAQSDPQALVAQLNEYLTAMVGCVFRYQGTLDKFIGDAVMAVWGNVSSGGVRHDAMCAVQAAIAMRAELVRLNKTWRERGFPEFGMGIAVHHGEVVVGNIGSPQRMEFATIGDAVNITWKLQEFTKESGSDLIVSQAVAELLKDQLELRQAGAATIRGVGTKVEVFSLADNVASCRKSPFEGEMAAV